MHQEYTTSPLLSYLGYYVNLSGGQMAVPVRERVLMPSGGSPGGC